VARTEGAAAPHRHAARGRWSSPVLTNDRGGGRAGRGGAREVLTSDGGVAKRWRTGGSERRRLELGARVKEGAKELGREGMRCGEGRGSHSPFIGVGGAPGRAGLGGNGGVNGFNAIEDGARLRGESDGGRVTARVASRGVELGGAGSGGRRWWRDRAQAEPEARDDRWSPPVSRARRGQRRRGWRRLPV
jgi:hypothetical protein